MKFVFYYVISLCKNDYTYIMSRHPSNKKVTYEKISGWWSTKTLNETLKILTAASSCDQLNILQHHLSGL